MGARDAFACAVRRRLAGDRGFTLIELMVTVLVIGILLSIAVPTYLGARTRTWDRAAQSELRTGVAAALTYYTWAKNYDGFDDTEGEAAEPGIAWVDGGAPAARQVSIQVHLGTDLLLVRRSGSGVFFCIAQIAVSPATPRGQGAAFADVDTVAECAGSW